MKNTETLLTLQSDKKSLEILILHCDALIEQKHNERDDYIEQIAIINYKIFKTYNVKPYTVNTAPIYTKGDF